MKRTLRSELKLLRALDLLCIILGKSIHNNPMPYSIPQGTLNFASPLEHKNQQEPNS